MGAAFGDGSNTRPADIGESIKIGLSDLKVDDLPPGGFHLIGFYQHLVGTFGLKVVASG